MKKVRKCTSSSSIFRPVCEFEMLRHGWSALRSETLNPPNSGLKPRVRNVDEEANCKAGMLVQGEACALALTLWPQLVEAACHRLVGLHCCRASTW